MTTPLIVDIDPVCLTLERIKGLLVLVENHIDSMFDSDRIESIPLNSAVWCIKDQINAVVELLNAGIDPEQDSRVSPRLENNSRAQF